MKPTGREPGLHQEPTAEAPLLGGEKKLCEVCGAKQQPNLFGELVCPDCQQARDEYNALLRQNHCPRCDEFGLLCDTYSEGGISRYEYTKTFGYEDTATLWCDTCLHRGDDCEVWISPREKRIRAMLG